MKQMLIGKKRNLISSLKFAFMSAMLVASSFDSSFAATGDIIYQNCTDGQNCYGAGSADGWYRTVETSGCHSGKCLKLVGVSNPNGDGLGFGGGTTAIGVNAVSGHSAITVQAWVKFSKSAQKINRGNMKYWIPYAGANRWGTVILPAPSSAFYKSRVVGTFTAASWFSPILNSSYATDNGDGTYTTTRGYTGGDINTAIRPGTTWTKLTAYYKLPNPANSNNGVIKIWYNDELMLDFPKAAQLAADSLRSTFTNFTFQSSEEAREAFEMWIDDMMVYEGYVPPSASGDNGVSIPPVTNTPPLAVAGFQRDN